MSNFDHAIQATETAMNSAGSAAQENERALESLESKTNNLRATFEDLANNVINNQLVKTVLDLANAFLKLLNTPVGTFATQVGLITGVLWGGTGLIQAMHVLPAMFGKLAEGVTVAGTATKIAFPHLLAISAAIAGIVAIAPKVIDWFKDVTNDVEYASGKSQEYSTKLEENKTKLSELYKIPTANRTQEIQANIEKLEQENEELKKNIDYWENKSNIGALEDVRGKQYKGKGYTIFGENGPLRNSFGRPLEYFVETEEEALNYLKELGIVSEDFAGTLDETGYRIVSFSDKLQNSEQYYASLITQQQAYIDKVNSGIEPTAQETEAAEKRNNELQEYSQILSSVPIEELTEQEKENYEETKGLADAYSEARVKLYDSEEALQVLAQGFYASKIQQEALVKDYPKLANYLEQTEYGYRLNADALFDLANAGDQWAISFIEAQQEATKKTIEETQKRIAALSAEMEAIRVQGRIGYTDADPKAVQQFNDYFKAITKAQGELARLKNSIFLEWEKPELTGLSDISSSTSSKSSKKETDPLKEQSDIYKELNEATEHNISLKEKQGAEVEALIQLYRDYQNQLHAQANWFREQGEGEDSAYIRELQDKWYEAESNITKLNQDQFNKRLQISKDYIDDRNKYADWGADSEIAAWKRVLDWMENEYYKKGLISYEIYTENRKEILENLYEAEKTAIENSYNDQIKDLQNKQKAYEALFSFVTDKINDKLEELNNERQKIIDDYDKEIEALQAQNEEIERQIELEQLQANLAKANQKKVMVYKDGKFQYIQDIDEISDAQLALEKYEREEALRQEVANLEAAKEKALDIIDQQIENWEKYKKEWSNVVNDYQKEQDRLLVLEELGIDLEGDLWESRIDNLDQYANEYKEILQSIIDAQKAANDALEALQAQQSQGLGGGIGGSGGSSGGTVTPGKGAPGKGFNAWAKIDGVGFVPVTVVDGKTQQTDLPAGTIIYGDKGAWQITGGKGGKDGYTSEYIGKTPSDIWTPSKGYGSSSSSSGGTSSSSNKGSSSNRVNDIDKQMAANSEKWHSASAEDKKKLEQANKDLAAERDKITGGSSKFDSTTGKWTKNARGTISARGGISLVGEKGAELRILNPGDGILPADITKNLWAWGTTTPADMMYNLSDMNGFGNGTNITIGTFAPNLPSVSNGEDFVRYIQQDFIREVVQFGSKR